MVKRKEYEEYLKNYELNVKTCFMAHNADWPQVRKIEKRCSNLTFDTFADSTNYLEMYKNRVSNDYDLIILDSSRKYSEYELEKMKKMALDISKSKNKRVTIAYSTYTNSPALIDVVVHQTIVYSIKDDKVEEEIIPISSKDWAMSTAIDLIVIVLDKHKEYSDQKQFKK